MPQSITEGRAPSPDPPERPSPEYEIEARTSLTEHVLRNLKHGDAFAVLDSRGDLGTIEGAPEGLFYRDTRYLSRFELRLEGRRPLLLGSTVHEDKAVLSVELTNPDLTIDGEKLARDSIFLRRTKFLWDAACYERIGLRNYTSKHRRLRVDFLFDADFRDLFEVRGTPRARRGTRAVEPGGPDCTGFRYVGLDHVERRTMLRFRPQPFVIDAHRATMEIDLPPYEQRSLFVTTICRDAAVTVPPPARFFHAYRDTRRARRAATADIATVTSSNSYLNDVVCRATSDVYTLMTSTGRGPYPYAGIPWFSTVFGRDGIITALLMLWMDPAVGRGVLRTLAATQADAFDPEADAQPGKILHEMRHGEMANLGEVPFRRYYGSVDATPLFVVLAGRYFERTGDLETIREIWPNIRAALDWIDGFGDVDGDGFVEYARDRGKGLVNQGWKDSYDAIFHADGKDAFGPIALCEVQGYVFAAKREAARLAARLGLAEMAINLERQSERLRAAFEEAFWCAEIGSYALALDGSKRPCKVVASNSGHALFAGIASAERAACVAGSLLSPNSFSGFGIRTLAFGQPRYNPMSYHNGSVWPHDNALIAIGFANYGLKAETSRVLAAIFRAASLQESYRLPELFCGFSRRPGQNPTPYPVACAPQAWAAASIFGLLGACLGLELVHARNEVRFRDPAMPDFLGDIVIRNLRLGVSSLDVRLLQHGGDATASVLKRRGDVNVAIFK